MNNVTRKKQRKLQPEMTQEIHNSLTKINEFLLKKLKTLVSIKLDGSAADNISALDRAKIYLGFNIQTGIIPNNLENLSTYSFLYFTINSVRSAMLALEDGKAFATMKILNKVLKRMNDDKDAFIKAQQKAFLVSYIENNKVMELELKYKQYNSSSLSSDESLIINKTLEDMFNLHEKYDEADSVQDAFMEKMLKYELSLYVCSYQVFCHHRQSHVYKRLWDAHATKSNVVYTQERVDADERVLQLADFANRQNEDSLTPEKQGVESVESFCKRICVEDAVANILLSSNMTTNQIIGAEPEKLMELGVPVETINLIQDVMPQHV